MTITAIKDLTGGAAASHGTVSYNGIAFNAFRRYQLEGEHVYDEAGRTVTHVRYTLTIATTAFAETESSLASTMEQLRENLSEPGQQLRIEDIGLGDIVVNGTGATHHDVEWGPKPQVLSMEAAGGVNAIEIVWRCVFSISECASHSAQSPTNPFLAFNYTAAYRITNGLTTRSIAGYAQVPLTRQVINGQISPVISTTIDSTWDRIVVPVPNGFRRVENERIISPDGARLDFNFVDQQLEGPAYPPGIVRAEASYSLGNLARMNFQQFAGTIEASYEVAPGLPKVLAANAFYTLLLSKLLELEQEVRRVDRRNMLTLDRIFSKSELYNQRASFSASFTVHGCLSSVLGTGGMWTPIAGTNYQQWASSMAIPWANRGSAGLRHNHVPVIIDVCSSITQVIVPPDVAPNSQSSRDFKGLFKAEVPPDGGWIAYENRTMAERTQDATVHKVLSDHQPQDERRTSDDEGNPLSKTTENTQTESEVQFNAAPTDTVYMTGKALRVQHFPTVPVLKTVGDVPVTVLEEVIDGPIVVGCLFNLKIYAVRWAMKYTAQQPLKKLPAQPGRMCCDSEESENKGQR